MDSSLRLDIIPEKAIAQLDSNLACSLASRICKAISNMHSSKITFRNERNFVCFITEDKEVVRIHLNGTYWYYFSTIDQLLTAMLMHGVKLSFFSNHIGQMIIIDLNKMFGTTLDELLINLDLYVA